MTHVNLVVVIPSLDPDEKTVDYVNRLIELGFRDIILVNDGSSSEYDHYFDEMGMKSECTVIKHAVNLGKGRAIKTGLNYFLNHYDRSEYPGVVTADSDGQHSPEDTLRVAQKLVENKNSLVLGIRDFNDPLVPAKQRKGRKITTVVFALLYSKIIKDALTGLRGLPYDFSATCLQLPGEGFDYEIGMLITAVREKRVIIEEKIQTIYYNNNDESHFKPVVDSIKIYALMFKTFVKYSLVSVFSFLIDISLFALFTKLVFVAFTPVKAIFYGTLLARILSSLFNFSLNKIFVFINNSSMKKTIGKYYILSVLQMLVSWLLVTGLFFLLKIDSIGIKIVVDLILFLFSYQVQRRWVFK
jgi:putative flippase GtrA